MCIRDSLYYSQFQGFPFILNPGRHNVKGGRGAYETEDSMAIRKDAGGGLIACLDRLHTTRLGGQRIRKNLSLDEGVDPVAWCGEKILSLIHI